MKKLILVIAVVLLTVSSVVLAQVPGIINYQGRIVDNGTNFTGTGQFQFALLSVTNSASQATAVANLTGQFVTSCTVTFGGSGYTNGPAVSFSGGGGSGAAATSTVSGGVVTGIAVTNAGSGYSSAPTVIIAPPPVGSVATPVWSNGVSAVSLTVTKGLYSVALGDTTVTNVATSIPAAIFTNSDIVLRVWFNDGVNGFQQLSPDQRVGAAGYALNAAMAQTAVNIVPTSVVMGQALDIGGGNTLSGTLATIAGGSNNAATASFSTIGGGWDNGVSGIGSFIGGGGYDGINLEGNSIAGNASVIGGGLGNTNFAPYSTIGGGYENTIQPSAANSTISGGWSNTIQSNAWNSTIGGGDVNTIQTNAYSSTIGGGGGNTIQINANDSTIGGGNGNIIQSNATFSTIGGGNTNTIQTGAYESTIGGGLDNSVVGVYATVPGGHNNTASGTASFAAGQSALATNDGAFVWSDNSSTLSFSSTVSNQFSARAAGGVRFFSNSGATLGVQLTNNATAWTTLSDRDAKANIEPISVREVLDHLVAMPISKWSYKDDPTQRRYIGPMAQDFHAAFGLGDDDKRISTLDSESVALAAIQGLNQKVEEKDTEIAALERRLADLESKLLQVSQQTGQLKATPQQAENALNHGGL
jgi:hypothetical protein